MTPRAAAFTMVRDESVFLDIWLRYYAGQLGAPQLYVIDHGSAEPVAAPAGVSVVRLPREPLDEITRCRIVTDFNAFLLASYDITVFSDADEIVAPDPARHENLGAYLQAAGGEATAGVGLALVQRRGEEPPIDPMRPILAQRGYAHFHGLYNKPLVARAPIQWKHGFHGAKSPMETDPDLYIFHLKAMDHALAHRMLDVRRIGPQSARMVEKQHSTQFRMNDAAFDAAYFATPPEAFDTAREDFDFTEELARFQAAAELDHGYGSLRTIPQRFHALF